MPDLHRHLCPPCHGSEPNLTTVIVVALQILFHRYSNTAKIFSRTISLIRLASTINRILVIHPSFSNDSYPSTFRQMSVETNIKQPWIPGRGVSQCGRRDGRTRTLYPSVKS